MSTVFRYILTAGLVFFVSLQGRANIEKILEITSESDPTIISEISLDTQTPNSILDMIYTPDIKQMTAQTFAMSLLLSKEVTLLSKMGVRIVGLQTQAVTSTDYVINLNYLYEFHLFNNTYKQKKISVKFSTPDHRFLIYDIDTQKEISKLHFVSHYDNNGKEVGIDHIDTL